VKKADRDELMKFLSRQPPESLTTLESLGNQLGRFLAFQEAIGLAVEERTGAPAPDECSYTAADFDRAEEILALYPPAGA
jgi:hypothetical protein